MQSYSELLSRVHGVMNRAAHNKVLLAVAGLVLGTLCWGGTVLPVG